jgi:hypothetical protein
VLVDVLGLGAWCDVAEDESRERVSFRISEFALLDDGRRVTLHDERGFSTRSSSGDTWGHLTLDSVTVGVRTTVLPDVDDTEEEHPWEWLAQLLTAHGVDVSPDRLRSVPYVIEYSDRLLARLTPRGGL